MKRAIFILVLALLVLVSISTLPGNAEARGGLGEASGLVLDGGVLHTAHITHIMTSR